MHSSLILNTLILSTADRPPLENTQRTCLRKFTDPASLRPSIYTTSSGEQFGQEAYSNLWDHFVSAPEAATEGVCGFRGIKCRNGIITSLTVSVADGGASTEMAKQACVDMAWLPPTIMGVSIVHTVMLNGWRSEDLPRKLRLMRLHRCRSSNSSLQPAGDKTIDLRKLPLEMENLYIVGGWYNGSVVIDDLPPKMQILYLSNANFREAIVNLDGLPVKMALVGIRRYGKSNTIKIHKIGGRPTKAVISGQKNTIVARMIELGKRNILE